MTKKDYVKFAELVRQYKEALENFGLYDRFVDDLTDILWKDNPRFSYQRFIEYIERTR